MLETEPAARARVSEDGSDGRPVPVTTASARIMRHEEPTTSAADATPPIRRPANATSTSSVPHIAAAMSPRISPVASPTLVSCVLRPPLVPAGLPGSLC